MYSRCRAEVIFVTDATCTYKVSIINIQGVSITICTILGICKLIGLILDKCTKMANHK